jgi:TetR/AcrR family transcriptional repressor of nem operon
MTVQRQDKRPRGRPVGFDRATAVKAALDRFWRRGFEAVSASDLADAMAIARSSFYNSFGDREAVFREALAAYKKISPDAELGGVRPGQPVVPVIRRMFRGICRVRAADPEARGCLVVNAIGELVGVNDALGNAIEEAVHNSLRTWEKLISQAVDQGEIDRPGNLRATAQSFVAFVIGLNAISKIVRSEEELWGLCRAFLDNSGMGNLPRRAKTSRNPASPFNR